MSHAIPKPLPLIAVSFLALTLLSACIYTPETKPRPANWAPGVSAPDLPNLHQVSPDLYRCANPGSEGYSSAAKFGIKTVVSLRSNAKPTTSTSKPKLIHIPVKTGSPSYDEARRFFEVVDNPKNQPVLLHCYHGADRTGAFTALYRINRQGWDKEDAIAEMTGGGYKFHTMWKSLIEWVRGAPEF